MKDLRGRGEGRGEGDGIGLAGVMSGLLSAIGLGLVLVGAVGCVQLFMTAHGFVKDPQAHDTIIVNWRQALGLAGAKVEVGGQVIAFEGPITVAMLFLGFFMLVILLGRILKAGLSLLSWTRDDRKARRAEPAPVAAEPPPIP